MTWFVWCYRLFENERGFHDFEPFREFNKEFEDESELAKYLDDKCAESTGEEVFVFHVEAVE